MAGKYNINYAIKLLFDDEFGLSGSETSAEVAKMLTAIEKLV